jgi:cellulose synthase/poly-beta-1,6-N-acetylglucosamine synthase-like glycosyltransferase
MENFLLFVLSLRIVLSVARCSWSILLRIAHPKWTMVKQDFSMDPTVSILLPCYNEGADVYQCIQTILDCDYPEDKFEVIATDDCSKDDSFQWIQKAEEDFPGRVRARQNPHNMGKSRTLIGASHVSTSDIIVVIDSDCIFAKDTIRQLVSCFTSPKMGVVGGTVGVRNPNVNVLTQVQTFVYFLAFDLWKTSENWTKSVTCVGGYLFAIRRHLFEEIEPKILARNWLGTEVVEGEDRFITHHALLLGYDTYVNVNARCWTKAPEKYPQFFKQQYRWRKSGVRDLFMAYKLLPKHIGTVHPNGIYMFTVAPLTLMLFTIGIFVAPFYNPLFFLSPIGPALAMTAGAILHWIIAKHCPEQKVKNPLSFALFGFWWIINSFYLTVLCLLTLDFSDWGSRAKKLEPDPQTVMAEEGIPEFVFVTITAAGND